MQVQDLIKLYETKTDEELLQLASESKHLTVDANTVLARELVRRRIDARQYLSREKENGDVIVEQTGRVKSFQLQRAGEFVAEVLRVYHGQFRFFVMLVAPAVLLGYGGVLGARGISPNPP